jgi:hypothetical protein
MHSLFIQNFIQATGNLELVLGEDYEFSVDCEKKSKQAACSKAWSAKILETFGFKLVQQLPCAVHIC